MAGRQNFRRAGLFNNVVRSTGQVAPQGTMVWFS
jgi:hypothetical protein